tara:strand:+ start:1497 stop:2114 length:618 start_codon:yes stop_codon:yes gene_type:complete
MDQKPGIRKTPTADLTLHPDNPRQGDIGAIIESIEANGWYGTLVAQCSTGHVLAGNHRLQAARHCGIDKVPVHWVDVDDKAGLRILLADNRTSDLATDDDDLLAELLAALVQTDDGLVGTGYDGDDLDTILFDIERSNGSLGNLLDDVADTVEERAQAIEAAGIRSIIIPFSLDDYNEVVARLASLRTELGVDSNADVILRLTAK